MQITDIRIVELTGTIDDSEVYWEERPSRRAHGVIAGLSRLRGPRGRA